MNIPAHNKQSSPVSGAAGSKRHPGRGVRATSSIFVVAATLAVALAAPAVGKPIDRDTFNEPYSFVLDDYCGQTGLTVTDSGTLSGFFTVKSEGKAGLVHFQSSEAVRGVVTATDGAFITYREVTNGNDAKVVDNGDGTLTITTLFTGSLTAYNAAGQPITRNPGQHRERVVVDYNGTLADPDDDELISLEVLKESTGRNDDYCGPVLDALGVS